MSHSEEEERINFMQLPTLVDLLEAGAHFGHETSKWNPKMKKYIFTVRNHVHVLDLQETLNSLETAAAFASGIVARGGLVLFVGTKRQARNIVKEQAERCGMPFITTRWLGGTFTNFETILKSITKMETLRNLLASPDAETLTKKERAVIKNEIKGLEEVLQGLKELRKLPGAVFLVGAHNEKIAAKEALRCKVPTIAIVDTNADPEHIDYSIPANDDAVRSLEIIVKTIADAVIEGKRSLSVPDTTPKMVKG